MEWHINAHMQVKKDKPNLVMTSDTSISWGAVVHASMGQWVRTPQTSKLRSWGQQNEAEKLWGKAVLCQCDNAAVVTVVNSKLSRHTKVMHLIRSLVFIAAKFYFTVTAGHVSGHHNILADSLSRNRLQQFKRHVPQAQPTPIPAGPTDSIQTRLDSTKLDKAVDFYFQRELADLTQRTYSSAKRCCVQFCLNHGLVSHPVSDHKLCQYLAFLANR